MNKWMVVIAALALSGCVREHFRGDYGYSVENNMSAQTINPDAQYKDYPTVSGNGAKIEAGYQRYLKDDGKVEEGRVVEDVGSN